MGRPQASTKKGSQVSNENPPPQQNKAIIVTVLLCQVTIILSLVSFFYLSSLIYKPSHKVYNSGFEQVPVTCQTTELNLNNNCSWASCGEWCLTKTSGFCPQIYVTVRRNATDIVLENCSRLSTNSCPQANYESFKKFNCNNGTQCSGISGLFNCTNGHCANMSDQLLCHYKADGITIHSVKENKKLKGFFECHRSKCTKITKIVGCDRKFCPKITTTGVNTFLMYEDSVYTGDCGRAVASNAANGTNPGYAVNPTEIWTENKTNGYLIASCTKVERQDNSLIASDCLNGTVLPESQMPVPFVNFTTLWSVVEKSDRPLDPEGKFLPNQMLITIFNNSKLQINMESCVNTLRGECKEFTKMNGRDGRNHTATSRFPCFYRKDDSSFVVARFDLEKTRKELVVALVVPSVLFAVSFTALLVITRSVKVDDDSMLRCFICPSKRSKNKSTDEQIALKDGKSTENNESPLPF